MINMAIGMVRTKFVAILLGPEGVGLMGVYTSIVRMIGIISGMGINTSGVRNIAEAHGKDNQESIAQTVKTLRLMYWGLGFLGLLFTILCCNVLSRISFGSTEHTFDIAFLGVTILLTNIATGQSCILQGTRRISDLARVSILGAINGTIISIPCYYFWGQEGIVPSLILMAVATAATSWWYVRKVPIIPVDISWPEKQQVAIDLLRFGIPFMLSILLTNITAYVIRIFLLRLVGMDGVGIWLAAFNLSGILINFVLSSMSADYLPRLSAVANDNKLINEAVNDQTEVAILLSVPGLAATLIFAPIAIAIFYSGKFDAAIDILRWSVYGVFGRVISWPLGFIMPAKGMGKTFFASQAFSNLLHIALIWFCTKRWGLVGTGVASVILYFIYTILVCIIGYVTSQTTWTRTNLFHILSFTCILTVNGLVSVMVVNPWLQYTINIVLLAGTCVYCLQRLMAKSGANLKLIFSKLGINY